VIAVPPPVHPWPIGAGPRYHPTAANQAVLNGSSVGKMKCANGRRFAVHIELFAARQVMIVPPGIGVARSGCTYPLRTNAPTGVVEVLAGSRYTLRDLFGVWGRRFDATHLLSFRSRVSLFVGGKRRTGDPRQLVLTKHSQIVIEVGGYVAPHPSYLFPRGGP
jgi:hypothetical protein